MPGGSWSRSKPGSPSRTPHRRSEVEAFDRADQALRALAALSGLMHENINRVAGWRFLDMGRRIERGITTCRFARIFATADATADDLDVLLDLVDSQITYRSRYRGRRRARAGARHGAARPV